MKHEGLLRKRKWKRIAMRKFEKEVERMREGGGERGWIR